MYQIDDYLNQLYPADKPKLSWNADGSSDWQEWRHQLKARFIEALGGFPAEHAPLEPALLERVELDGYIRERIEITTYPGLRMPAYVLIPSGSPGPFPVAVASHGHGYGSREVVGLKPDGSDLAGEPNLHKNMAVELVERGFLVISPELIGFGDRRLAEDIEKGPKENSCFRLAAALLMRGRTLGGHRVYETMRAIDYILGRDEAQAGRLGMMGLSGGGLVAGFTAALDERIGATVVSGYTNTFKDSILAMRHCIDNYIPGILEWAEMPDLIGLIAPRPLLVEAGSSDPIFPIQGTLDAIAQLERIYRGSGAEGAVEHDIFEGKHEVSGRRSFDWLKERV